MNDDWITPLSIPLMIVLAWTGWIGAFVVIVIYALPFLFLFTIFMEVGSKRYDAKSISQVLATRRRLRELGICDPLER
jgi:ABC-type transport system involved in cytochrome bd biosynthesis fused ATPase/permease subunit